jgi:alpha-1,2-mannosyltransferase
MVRRRRAPDYSLILASMGRGFDWPARTALTWVLVVSAVVAIGVGIQEGIVVRDSIAGGNVGPINDFDRWMIMTPQFLREHADYVDDNMPTAPLTLLVFAPFTLVPRPAAQFLWACFKLPFVIGVLLLALALARRSGVQVSGWSLALLGAAWWFPVMVDLQQGQVNFLALLPLVAALVVVQNDTPGAQLGAGALIGLATVMKVTPIVFVVYFLWRRRWLVGGGAAAGLFAGFVVVPALAFGWNQNLRWLSQWTSIMITPYLAHGSVVYSTTQSVGSFALRLFRRAPAFEIHRNGVWEYGYMNVADLSTTAIHQIVRAVMVAVGAAGLAWTRRPLVSLRSPRYVLEVGAIAAFMLWFSERTWVHHYVSFVITLSAACMILSDASLPDGVRRFVAFALLVFSAAAVFASDAGYLFGPNGVEWAKAIGVFLWPSVLVTLATVRATLGPRRGLEVAR